MESLRLVDESVWSTVGRAPALLKQIELGISAMSELNGILHSLAKSQSEFASSAIKSIAKKLPALQEKLTDQKNSTNLALMNFVQMVQDDAESVEQEHKFLNEQVVGNLVKFIEARDHEKAAVIAENEKRRKNIEQGKSLVDKRRRECLKQYRTLHDMLRKVENMRLDIQVEEDVGKKDKIIVNMNKIEAGIFKHKTVVRNTFLEFEKLVDQVNEHMKRYYNAESLEFIEKLEKIEREKNQDIKKMLDTFLKQDKMIMQARVDRREKVLQIVESITEESDSKLFLQSNVPETVPVSLSFDLPCHSSVVENDANALLKSGALIKPSSNNLNSTSRFSIFGRSLAMNRHSSMSQSVQKSPSVSDQKNLAATKSPILEEKYIATDDKVSKDIKPAQIRQSELMEQKSPPIKHKVFEPKPPPRKLSDQSRLVESKPLSHPDLLKGKTNSKKVVALYDYHENSDNSAEFLSFSAGETIIVTSEDNDIWWTGFLLSDPTRTEKWFPAEYINR